MDQRTLVERAQRGDHDAFAEFAGASVARLDAAARLILRDPELAHDAVQESFIRAWRDLAGLRDPDKFDAWLRRLTVNACLSIIRRHRHRAIEVELTRMDAPCPCAQMARPSRRSRLAGVRLAYRRGHDPDDAVPRADQRAQ